MTAPYYEQAGITIYHGDCRAILADDRIRMDAIVTDPPFGTGWGRGGGGVGQFVATHEQPAWDVFTVDWLTIRPVQFWAVFCAQSRAPALGRLATGRVAWRKTNPRPLGPATEPIFLWPVYVPAGLEWVGYNGDTPYHPCQKPEALMAWLLGFCDPAWVVCDPFMGSGTTLVAAKRIGRRAIGVEANERYCEIAAERLAQGALDLFGTVNG